MVQINNKYYIVDIEENPGFFFFPFITWVHIYTLYELKEGQASRIFAHNKTKGTAGIETFSTYYFLIVGISFVLVKTVVSSGIAYIPFLYITFFYLLFLFLVVDVFIFFLFVLFFILLYQFCFRKNCFFL